MRPCATCRGVLSEGTAGGQLGALSGQFIRGGVSSQTLILLDGRPLNEVGGFGAFDLSNFTTDAVEQIEVLPGGGSVLYGSNAISGVINIITRRPPSEAGLETAATAAVGSFGFNDQVIQLRGREDDLSWVLGYNRTAATNAFPFSLTSTDFDGVRTNADVLYNNLNFSATTALGDRSRLRFGLLFLSKDLGVPGGVPVPGSISGGFNALTADDSQYSENWLLDLTYEADLGQADDSRLTARLFGDLLSLTFNNPVADSPFAPPSRDLVDQSSVGAQVQHAWQVAPNQNLTYGVDYRQVVANNTTLNLLTDTLTDNYRESIKQAGLFARYQVDITPRFSANLGVRQDFNDLADGSFTSFNLGTGVQVTETTRLRANFARNFRVPTLGDLFFAPFNNPNLGPESGLSFDIGVDQRVGRSRAAAPDRLSQRHSRCHQL
ncbi:MAG: TonB-dependent receptor [Leptolyngbyaceae cyanobacterium SM2_5_2]|nr:TonB-dependent receptor [Leptolyngbyaceae cyanobacterium SM2_5_2]